MSTRLLNTFTLSKSCFGKLIIYDPKHSSVKWTQDGGGLCTKSSVRIPNKNQQFTNFGIWRRRYCDYFRHKYDPKIEKLVNEQINAELNAAYNYLNIATYYARSNVALPGLHGFFMKMFYEEIEHGLGFIKFQNMRGGMVTFAPLKTFDNTEWEEMSKAFCTALEMEKSVKEKLVTLTTEAGTVNDTNVQDFLDPYIQTQEKSIQEMSRYLTRVQKLEKSDVGKYLFDRELHQTHVRKEPAKCEAEIGSHLYT